MPSAARLGDLIGHAPPIPPSARGRGGPGGVPTGLIIGPCSGNVFVNGIPAARSGVDLAVCSLHPPVPLQIASGSSNVFINGCPAARLGDLIKCSAIIITGSGNVFIGGGGRGASGTVQTDVLLPELETEPVILQSLEGSDAGADSLDESIPSMSYGEQMSKVGGFYGDLAIGAAKGILNLIPETLAFAHRMSGYAIAGVASHFDTDISDAMFAKYEKVTGRLWQYENSVQEFGGVAAQLASPMIARSATTVGAVIYNAEIGALRVAATEVAVIQSKEVEAVNLARSSVAESAAAKPVLAIEMSNRPGSVARNAMSDAEYLQAQEIVGFKGGHFEGAPTSNFAGIDGWLDGTPVQLKDVTGKSLSAIQRNIVGGANDMAKQGYVGDLFIDTTKTGISMEQLTRFAKPGSPISNILNEGAVNNVYVKTPSGWLNITKGTIVTPPGG